MEEMPEEGLKVARVMSLLGVSRRQLYYWEKQGLLGKVQRLVNPDSGMEDRIYSKRQLLKIEFINYLRHRKIQNIETIKYLLEYVETGHIVLADEAWRHINQ